MLKQLADAQLVALLVELDFVRLKLLLEVVVQGAEKCPSKEKLEILILFSRSVALFGSGLLGL